MLYHLIKIGWALILSARAHVRHSTDVVHVIAAAAVEPISLQLCLVVVIEFTY